MTESGPLSTPLAWNTVATYAVGIVPLFSLSMLRTRLPSRKSLRTPTFSMWPLVPAPSRCLPRTAEHVVAVDFAEAMVNELGRRAAEQRITNVEAHVADGQALPFADATFNAAFSRYHSSPRSSAL
jgi:hypothetical protein